MESNLVAIPEIAEILEVSRQRASKIIQTYADFPTPAADLSIGRVWDRVAVERWAAQHPRRPGRPAAPGPALSGGNRPPSGGAGGRSGVYKRRGT